VNTIFLFGEDRTIYGGGVVIYCNFDMKYSHASFDACRKYNGHHFNEF